MAGVLPLAGRPRSTQEDLYAWTGRAITILRERAGISQVRAGELLGISQQRVSGIERGFSPIPLDLLLRMLDLYEWELHRLLPIIDLAENGKKCGRCLHLYPAHRLRQSFALKKGSADGLHPWCKECRRVHQKLGARKARMSKKIRRIADDIEGLEVMNEK